MQGDPDGGSYRPDAATICGRWQLAARPSAPWPDQEPEAGEAPDFTILVSGRSGDVMHTGQAPSAYPGMLYVRRNRFAEWLQMSRPAYVRPAGTDQCGKSSREDGLGAYDQLAIDRLEPGRPVVT
jgi:hypothetical protein